MQRIKWGFLLAITVLVALVSTSCVPFPRKSVLAKYIIPGERIGPIFIGQRMVDGKEEAIRLAGPVETVLDGHGFTSIKDPGGFGAWDKITSGVNGAIAGETPGRVLLIAIYEDSVKLEDGLGVGSDPFKFHEKYGDPPVVEELVPFYWWAAWPEQGVAIIVKGGETPIVVAVVVFPRVERK